MKKGILGFHNCSMFAYYRMWRYGELYLTLPSSSFHGEDKAKADNSCILMQIIKDFRILSRKQAEEKLEYGNHCGKMSVQCG